MSLDITDFMSIEVVFNKPSTVEFDSREELKAQRSYSTHWRLVWYTGDSLIDGHLSYRVFSNSPRMELCACLGHAVPSSYLKSAESWLVPI